MRVVIVGGAGFIGCAVASLLASRNIAVSVLDSAERLARTNGLRRGIQARPVDFALERDYSPYLAGADALVHLGCTTNPAHSMQSMAFDAQSNIGPSVRLFEAAAQVGVRRVVFASSGGTVYGVPERLPVEESAATNPLSGYGVSKLAIEKYLGLFHQFEGISLRVANPYGAFQLRGAAVGVIARYVSALSRGEPLHVWGDGRIVRDYIAIEDVADAFAIALLEPGMKPGVYNIGSGAGASIDEIIALISKVAGRRADVVYSPARAYDVPAIVLDSSRFSRCSGWSPGISLDEGIGKLWAHACASSETDVLT